jgi:hypothetical protein
MRPLKILSVIIGLVLVLAGALSVASAGFVLGISRAYSSPSGFFVAPAQEVGSYGFALTVPDINEQLTGSWERWGLQHARATVRVTGSSKLPAPIFIGVASTTRVSQYLSGVTRDRITSIDLAAGSVEYEHVDGMKMPAVPTDENFWVATASGTGSQTLEWTLEQGDWAVVVMNADGSAPVAADMRLSARFGIVTPLMVGLAVAGILVAALGATLIVLGRRRGARPPRAGVSYPQA